MDKKLDVLSLFQKADHQFSRKLPNFGVITLKRVLTIDSKSADAYYSLGFTSFKQRQYSKSERLFKRAIMINPTFLHKYFDFGLSLKSQGRFKQALKVFQQILHMNPAFFPAGNSYGETLFYMGDFHRAAEQFSKVLAKKPQDSNANSNMGFLLLIWQRYQEAMNCFRTAIDQNPNETGIYEWINCGLVLWHTERKEEALKVFKKGVAMLNKAEKQEVIGVYTGTLKALEKRTLQVSHHEEKIGLEKTISGVKYVLGLL